MIQEITYDMMDERAWMWTRVLAAVNEPAIERALRLDLNTGVVTVMGPGRDRVIGTIIRGGDIEDVEGIQSGREYFWSPGDGLGYELFDRNGSESIAVRVYWRTLDLVVGRHLPIQFDEDEGVLCWSTGNSWEPIDVRCQNLTDLRDAILAWCAEAWASEISAEIDLRTHTIREETEHRTRFLVGGGNGSVEIEERPQPGFNEEPKLVTIHVLDRDGYGIHYHLSWGTEEARTVIDNAIHFLMKRKGEKGRNK